MHTAKQEVAALLERLPESISLEDVQYHLYVIEKIRRGLDRAESEGTLSQAQAEEHLGIMAGQVVVWSPGALEDVDSIAAYIARDSVFYAGAVVEKMLSAAAGLNQFPEPGRSSPNSTSPTCVSASYIVTA